MQFKYSLYPYQTEILNVFEREQAQWEKKIHIVAPPWSWKTIIGLEIMRRINKPTLILVPNLTLQEQWKDKLESLFLNSHESSNELISTEINTIRKINIITYQALAGSDDGDNESHAEILNLWFNAEKGEFDSRETFLLFASELKESNPEEYWEFYGKYRKQLKKNGDSKYTRDLMKGSIHEYIDKLRSIGIGTMIVDEAHHLTSWWSRALYEIWNDLAEPYIIGLTATPPFDDSDYFELDESYVKLLGTVDYYVPTPAIVKSGRLAPYSDLAYIVHPDESLSTLLATKEKLLEDFLATHQNDIVFFLHAFLIENHDRLKVKSLDLLEKWMRFIYRYKDASIDMSPYITQNASHSIGLEDIAKSVGKWVADGFKNTQKSDLLDEVKKLFFDLGYIWRGSNLYRFETPIEKWLIYSKSKINWVHAILETEKINLWKNLRVAIISDFLDVESDWINAHFIFDEVTKKHPELNPYLVSGQGIWQLINDVKTQLQDETILSVTEKLTRWETKLIIGTRGILGEGWDCPALNTLIDLTGVSAYMSVNQVHGRAIRIDPSNPEKVANIYDIVCIWWGYQWFRDFERLEKKHAQFYGVDDSGLVIKELDHIYPQLDKFVGNPKKINAYTLRKSTLRSMVRTLWNIGSDFKNEEVFSVSIEILKPLEQLCIPSKIKFHELIALTHELNTSINFLEIGKTTYHSLIRRWIDEILKATLQTMKPFGLIPEDFSYTMRWSHNGSIKITGNHSDEFVNKKFLGIIAPMFGPVTNEKYVIRNSATKLVEETIPRLIKWFAKSTFIEFGFLWSIIWWVALLMIDYDGLSITISVLLFLWLIAYPVIKKRATRFLKSINSLYSSLLLSPHTIWIPYGISSNEEKRERFIWKSYGTLPEEARWYKWLKSRKFFVFGKSIFIAGTVFSFWILSIYPTILNWPIEIVDALIVSITFWFLLWSSLLFGFVLCTKFIHFFYKLYAITRNWNERRKIIQLFWEITLTTQNDIGKEWLLSAKIEKLWI